MHCIIIHAWFCTPVHSYWYRWSELNSELSLIITNAGQYLSWPEFGLSLHIPENSLPEGIDQCSMSIKTRTLGDYKFPKDSHLVSAVYSIKCIPKYRFSEPVTLEIQHCAKPKNTHKLSFVRAIRSDSEQKTSLLNFNWCCWNGRNHKNGRYLVQLFSM